MQVINAEIFRGDLLVAFSNNRTALFPAAFLYEATSQVQEIFDSERDGEPELSEGDENAGNIV